MFWVIAVVSVPAALGMIFARKAVYCAMLLAVVMLSLATAYAVLEAPFLAFVQVIVYTGAVLMLFLFVIMLVGVSSTDSLVETIRGQRLWAGIAGLGFIVLLIVGLGQATLPTARGLAGPNRDGNVFGLAGLIFTKYVFAFEVTSALLITAALGAMVLAHRERTTPKPTQKDLSKRRFESGRHPAPLPGPGTYARHNAVDMPALLPDGSISELSVNPVIGGRPELNRSLHADLEGETEREAVADDVAAVRAATVRGEAETLPGADARPEARPGDRAGGRSGAEEDDR
jgi:NADH-quinone oxidoreductase subunit J